MRILIVDDDEMSRVLLHKMLLPFGECMAENDGKKGLGAFVRALYQGVPFDLILLDIMMPEIDGQELLKIIRKVEKQWGVEPGEEAKVIMVTALDSPREAMQAFFDGCATDYLVKPIERETLLKKVESISAKICKGNEA